MITVNLHITEGPVSRHVRVRAASLKRAMRIAGNGRPGVRVELAGPLRLIPGGGASVPSAAAVGHAA